jgi:hypothetical protein
MLTLYRMVLSFHVAAGIIGLAAFWTPAFSRKGGTTHVQVGRVFYKATCAIAITGLAMAALTLAAPLAVHPSSAPLTPERAAAAIVQGRMAALFLLYLVIITFAPVHHGVRVLETRRTPEKLRTPFHTALGVTAIVAAGGMIVLAVVARQPVFAALSPIGLLVGRGNLRFAAQPYATPMAWWYEHMGSMLGAGRLLGLQLTGFAAVVPWILPSMIGIPATAIWVAYYRRKFHEDEPSRPRRAVVAS